MCLWDFNTLFCLPLCMTEISHNKMVFLKEHILDIFPLRFIESFVTGCLFHCCRVSHCRGGLSPMSAIVCRSQPSCHEQVHLELLLSWASRNLLQIPQRNNYSPKRGATLVISNQGENAVTPRGHPTRGEMHWDNSVVEGLWWPPETQGWGIQSPGVCVEHVESAALSGRVSRSLRNSRRGIRVTRFIACGACAVLG